MNSKFLIEWAYFVTGESCPRFGSTFIKAETGCAARNRFFAEHKDSNGFFTINTVKIEK